ncbi:hypothetical protein, partial [Mycolicibacterium fortuitum]|uniref:hypothetical protein n=1 Tax=Mycolicibacterium fortuitum TaxID=1766 RepID=UPI001A7E596C
RRGTRGGRALPWGHPSSPPMLGKPTQMSPIRAADPYVSEAGKDLATYNISERIQPLVVIFVLA